MKLYIKPFCSLLFILTLIACSKGQTPSHDNTGGNNTGEDNVKGAVINSWVTGGNILLKSQNAFYLGKKTNSNINIDIDLEAFFSKIRLAETNNIMIPGKKAMELADYGVLLFKIE